MVIADDPRSMDELGELSARERALKRELIEHLRRDIYVKLAPSSIEGVGVIAVRDVPAGVNPFQTCNATLAKEEVTIPFSAAEIATLPDSVVGLVKSFFAPLTDERNVELSDERGGIVYGVNATGLNTLDVSWYLNHSDEPNVRSAPMRFDPIHPSIHPSFLSRLA